MNCAGNAVTAIAQCSYAEAAENPASRELMSRLIEETVAVARAAGIRLPNINFIDDGIKSLAYFWDCNVIHSARFGARQTLGD